MRDEQIVTLCSHHGLLVREVRRAHDVLVLVPESLDVMPPAARLQQLAEALKEEGDFKYVALAVDDDL